MNQIEIQNIVRNYLNDQTAEVGQMISDTVDFLGNLFTLPKIDATQTALTGATNIDKPANCARVRRIKIGDVEIKKSEFDNLENAEIADVLRWYEDNDKIQFTDLIESADNGETITIWYDEAFNLPFLAEQRSMGSGNSQLYYPNSAYSDGFYVYICDTANHRIVKLLASDLSYVTKIGTQGAGNDQFDSPSGITGDGAYLYISDTANDRIVKRLASDLSYVAQYGASGAGNGQFAGPRGIYLSGNYLYVADYGNDRIQKLTINPFTYSAKYGTTGAGNDELTGPLGVTGDGTNIYISDGDNKRIVKRLAADLTYISKIGSSGTGDDNFKYPYQISCDGTHIYIADVENNRIVKRLAADLSYVSEIGNAGDVYQRINRPAGVYIYDNIMYIIDTYNHRIVKRNSDFASLDTNIPVKLLDLVYVGATYRYYRMMLSIKVTSPATYTDIDLDSLRKILEEWRKDFNELVATISKDK